MSLLSQPPRDDAAWMDLALQDAALAMDHGDVPIAALVVGPDGTLLSQARNCRERDADPTGHAEVLALRAAAAARGHWRLHDCTLYVTLEPCVMCAGALVNARIGRLVYAAPDLKAGAIASLYRVAEDERLNHRFAVTAGVLEEQSRLLLQTFFRSLRARGNKWPSQGSTG
jgi:tRNA(adenine34) deaminase